MHSELTGRVDDRGETMNSGDLEAVMAAEAMCALGRLAPLLRSPDMWQRVEGLDELSPILDLRLRELDLRSPTGDGAEATPAGPAGPDPA